MIKKIGYYLRETLWNFSLDQRKGWEKFYVKWLRIIYLSISSLLRKRSSFSASSLTYFTLMSIVPMIALSLAITRGLGYHELFREQLLARFSDQAEAFDQIFQYADAFLAEARGGIIAAIGLGVLFLAVLSLLYNLESILNEIWGVKQHRSFQRVMTDYCAILLIVPIFFVVASSATIMVSQYLEELIRIFPINNIILFVVNLIPYGLFWMLFTFLYVFMPNVKVRVKSAGLGALVAACLSVFSQWAYVFFQTGASHYGAIYGTMAALPLFLIWLQLSWFMVLLGAEVAWAHQTFRDHEFAASIRRMSHSFRRLMALRILRFTMKKGMVTLDMLTQQLHFPTLLANILLEELVESQMLQLEAGKYFPNPDILEMKISDVLHQLDSCGEELFPFIDAKSFKAFRLAVEKDPKNRSLNDVAEPPGSSFEMG